MTDSSAHDIAKSAKSAFEESQLISAEEHVKALHEIRDTLATNKDEILKANQEDLAVSLTRKRTIHANSLNLGSAAGTRCRAYVASTSQAT